ncbi:AraC family transcriptional regulator [Alteraurantiacibacter aquimixticola]|uniref:AraC family transcriptional regulator n=1 Tax=Alteraurantiacibacter aquimixticola TaxID=2489173 RepID=A0A4T3EXF1_9SPHN|nr:helix-turn-helix domain-containing protein [Alteraurantiacibacter aquimixticola]TIX49256.1 AraC family transcriptional regulator [Alteraurantiacibacter aquimixticola]
MSEEFAIDVRFYRLSVELQPYFTALYSFTIICDDDVMVEDRLHPEWAAMRFTESGSYPIAAIAPDDIAVTWPFVASGPTSRAIKFGLKHSRVWGLGLQPAGWAKYVTAPASQVADRIVNAGEMDCFSVFWPILDIARNGSDDTDETARQINGYLMEQDHRPVPGEAKILACQEALRDAEVADVAILAERMGMERRTLERLCSRYFGFPPKMLIRRARFLRSLARFMLEPMQNWSRALDEQYFDHAHFVRDFRSFMGITPTEYAEAPHPVLERIMAQRMADQGAAPPTDLPTVLRYRGRGSSRDQGRD